MGVELVRKHVSSALRNCYRSASRHPLLVFMVFLLNWIYLSFPLLFSLLLYASPVIASTLVLLGTLLLFGHENAPEIQKDHKLAGSIDTSVSRGSKSELGIQKTIVGEEKVVLVNRCARLQPSHTKNIELKCDVNSRRNSFDTSHSALGQIDDDNKGWESGSDLVESSSPSASMADNFPMLDELDPLLESEIPERSDMFNLSTDAASDHSFESGEMINETDDFDDDEEEEDIAIEDDEEGNVISWTEDDERNLMNLGTSELERNQHLENLIAKQKALKNIRILAERSMLNFTPGLPISTARMNPFDSNENILGSAPPFILPKNPFDLPYDPSAQKPDQVGPNFQSNPVAFPTNDPFNRRHGSFDVGPSNLGASDISDEVKMSGGNEKGHEGKTSSKSSSSSFSDATDDIYDGNDDDGEEEYRSIDNSTQDLKELQIQDSIVDHSEIGDTEKGGLPQRLSQVQHGLTLWLTGWRA